MIASDFPYRFDNLIKILAIIANFENLQKLLESPWSL